VDIEKVGEGSIFAAFVYELSFKNKNKDVDIFYVAKF
jgi:hypothetical protein